MAQEFIQKSKSYMDLSVLEQEANPTVEMKEVEFDYTLADSIIESVKQYDLINLRKNVSRFTQYNSSIIFSFQNMRAI